MIEFRDLGGGGVGGFGTVIWWFWCCYLIEPGDLPLKERNQLNGTYFVACPKVSFCLSCSSMRQWMKLCISRHRWQLALYLVSKPSQFWTSSLSCGQVSKAEQAEIESRDRDDVGLEW